MTVAETSHNFPDVWIRTVYAPEPAGQAWSLADLLGSVHIRYFSFARIALTQALDLLGVKAGESVLIPELICRDLLSSLHAVGARALFYPVGTQMEMAMDPLSLPKVRAIMAVNYFGFPQNLQPFHSYCARTGAILIENNAHGLFSRDEDGTWLGIRGDIGVFSLRKTIALPNGAALAIPSNSPFLPLPQTDFDSDSLRVGYRVKQGLRMMVPWLGHKPLRILIGCVRQLRNMKSGRTSPISGKEGETHFPQPSKPCALLAKPIVLADVTKEVERRCALYQFADRIVSLSGGRPIFWSLPKNVVPYVYPFYAQGIELQRTLKALDREGLDCFPWPELPEAVESIAPEHYKTLWCVRFLW